MSIRNTKREPQKLIQKGYRQRFIERDVHNHIEKVALIETFEPLHDLVYLEHPNGFRIELTRYATSDRKSVGAFSVDLDNPGLITLQTSSYEEDIEFLTKALRFRVKDINDNQTALSFSSPVKGWSCSLQINRVHEKRDKSYLDSIGFPCLAFISTSVQKDSDKLRILGARDITTPFSLTVDQKPLTIVMFRFPGGAIGELIEIDKK